MEMVPEKSTSKFKKGDLVKWWYSSPTVPHTVEKDEWVDLGVVMNVEIWEGDNEIREVIEVFFFHAGTNWCNPKSLELISKY